LVAFYTVLRFNTSIRQLDAELNVSYRSLRRHVEQFARTLDTLSIDLVDPVGIDEFNERKLEIWTAERTRKTLLRWCRTPRSYVKRFNGSGDGYGSRYKCRLWLVVVPRILNEFVEAATELFNVAVFS
jgi:transposase-like protein